MRKMYHIRMVVVLLLLSLLPLSSLFHSGLLVTHDGADHVARIANFYQSLSEGNIIPRWAMNLNWGYGHPILMFLYPLPSYVASLFHALGFTFVDSTKLVFGLGYVASMITMYMWAASVWGIWPGLTAAVLYGFAPYRFVDLYVRGAIGEHTAFIFLPIILWGVHRLSLRVFDRVALWTISFSTALLILSHNALSIMFLPIVMIYILYTWRFESKEPIRFFLASMTAVIFGFFLSAFFWVPAFWEGKYTLRDIVTKNGIEARFVPWTWFFYSPWNYGGGDALSKSLGLSQLVALGIALVSCLKPHKNRLITAGTVGILLVSLFVMTESSHAIWTHVSLLQKFQFPWRFLSVSVFAAAVLGALVIVEARTYSMSLAVILSVLAVIGTSFMWHPKAYTSYPTSYFSSVYAGTTDTGESSPIWSIRFMEHTASASASVIQGAASIVPLTRTTTYHSYDVHAATETRMVENTLYFPGWRVLIDAIPASIEFQDPLYRGLMTFRVPQGNHTVEVVFADTKLRLVSNVISLSAFVLFSLILGTMQLWRKKR